MSAHLTSAASVACSVALSGVRHLRKALITLAHARGHDPHAVSRLCDEAAHAVYRAAAAAGGLPGARAGVPRAERDGAAVEP